MQDRAREHHRQQEEQYVFHVAFDKISTCLDAFPLNSRLPYSMASTDLIYLLVSHPCFRIDFHIVVLFGRSYNVDDVVMHCSH